MSDLRETLNAIEVARDLSPEVLAFLKDVVAGKFLELRQEGPVSMRDRLQAAEIIRKYAALPSNVAIDLGITEKLVYVGDDPRKVEDGSSKGQGDSADLLRTDGSNADPAGGPRVGKKGTSARRSGGRKSERQVSMAS